MVSDWFNISLFELISAAIVFAFFLIQLWYYFHYFNGVVRESHNLPEDNSGESSDNLPPVSVIICSHDQAHNLEMNLSLVLQQKYPVYEVIVVNDASSDNTEDVLSAFEKKYKNLYKTFVPAGVLGSSEKKMAISIGIKAAKYDHLLFTDPDCIPASDRWIESMFRGCGDSCGILLGYSSFTAIKGIMRSFVMYDELFTALKFMGFARRGKPYMGFGKNLAYKKDLFFRNRGFASNLILKSGYDDIYIGEIANESNTKIRITPESKVLDTKDDVWQFWKDQKISRFSTSAYYKAGTKFRLSFETCSRFLFYVLSFALLIYGLIAGKYLLSVVAFVLFLIRYIVQLVIINKSATQLDEKKFYFSLPFYDFVSPVLCFFLKITHLSERKSSYTWQKLR